MYVIVYILCAQRAYEGTTKIQCGYFSLDLLVHTCSIHMQTHKHTRTHASEPMHTAFTFVLTDCRYTTFCYLCSSAHILNAMANSVEIDIVVVSTAGVRCTGVCECVCLFFHMCVKRTESSGFVFQNSCSVT